MSYGTETEALAMLSALTAGLSFTIPNPDLSGPEYDIPGGNTNPMFGQIAKLTNADLTDGTLSLTGDGTFDILMQGFTAHLRNEYDKGRITGAEYTKSYTALTEAAMGNGVQFLLGRDQAYWQAQTAQIQAITARVQLVIARTQLAAMQYDALTKKAEYALTTAKLATESAGFGVAKYNLENTLPQQKLLLGEQTEAARAQTMNTRTDGSTVTGSIGKQKDLYTQQITSYQRDAENKAAKFFLDGWVTQKTMDEGLVAPSALQNSSVDTVLNKIKLNNGLT